MAGRGRAVHNNHLYTSSHIIIKYPGVCLRQTIIFIIESRIQSVEIYN